MKRFATILMAIAIIGGVAFFVFRAAQKPQEPAKSVAAAAHAHDDHEDGVALSAAKIAAAGIEIERAAPGVLRDSLTLNGIIQPNQEALVQITPRFAGVVRELRKRIGDEVQKGEVLATIESNQSLTAYELKTPIGGTIIERQASLGEYASEQKAAFVVADLSTVWIDFSVYRRDFSRVRTGDTVLIDPEDGGAPIEARIAYVSPIGTSDTQSGLARAVVKNDQNRLRPGLFVTGRLMLTPKQAAVVVHASALQMHDNRTVVFVRHGDHFEPRAIEVGERDHDRVEVVAGLQPDEHYAAKNSFVVKAELNKGAASHAH